ncbi:MAG: hypothetical protein KBD00_06150 [Candidatus Peribacteraceae bacterium]|nr:hypothetical protein [Candidatus Peribacteraceae bacterium]
MIPSLSNSHKAGLGLFGILLAAGASTLLQPQIVHGTPDCTTEWAAVTAETDALDIITGSGDLILLDLEDAADDLDIETDSVASLNNTLYSQSGSLTSTGVLATFASMDTATGSIATLSGTVKNLHTELSTTIDSINMAAFSGALKNYDDCINQ